MRKRWSVGMFILLGLFLIYIKMANAAVTVEIVTYPGSHRGSQTVYVGQTCRISVRVISTRYLVNTIELYFSSDNGLSWQLIEVFDKSDTIFAEGTTRYVYNESFDWVVPDIESRECFIRADAYDRAGTRASDISDRAFTIQREPDTTPPTVRVISPNGGEVWETLSSYTIRWEASDPLNAWETSDSPDRVRIDILYQWPDGSSTYIAEDLPNTGSYRWFIFHLREEEYPITGTIVIRAHDAYGNVGSDTSDGTITIVAGDITPPTVTVRYPNSGLEVWRKGEVRNILWTATDNVEVTKVDILYKYFGPTIPASPWKYIARGAPNTGSYSWRIPDDILLEDRDAGGELYTFCWIKVKAYDAKNNTGEDTNDMEFVIKERGHTTPVQIRVTSPNGGEFWKIGERVYIRWIVTGLWREVKVNLSRDRGRTWEYIGGSRSRNYCSWVVTGPSSPNCLIEIVVYDNEGKIADRDTSNRSFTITSIARPPKVPIIPKMPKQKLP